jgi:hypothetical protein
MRSLISRINGVCTQQSSLKSYAALAESFSPKLCAGGSVRLQSVSKRTLEGARTPSFHAAARCKSERRKRSGAFF